MQRSTTAIQQRIVAQIKAEPRKAAALGVLAAVMGVLWLKSGSSTHVLPSSASARALSAPSDSQSPAMSTHAEKALRDLTQWLKKPLPESERNLFSLKMDYFPADGSRPPEQPRVGQSFWDELGKSLASKADQEKARRILLDNLRIAASSLNTQGTMMANGSPKALVNGTWVGEGETVAGFKIVQIEAQRMIVEREGVRLEVAFNFTK